MNGLGQMVAGETPIGGFASAGGFTSVPSLTTACGLDKKPSLISSKIEEINQKLDKLDSSRANLSLRLSPIISGTKAISTNPPEGVKENSLFEDGPLAQELTAIIYKIEEQIKAINYLSSVVQI